MKMEKEEEGNDSECNNIFTNEEYINRIWWKNNYTKLELEIKMKMEKGGEGNESDQHHIFIMKEMWLENDEAMKMKRTRKEMNDWEGENKKEWMRKWKEVYIIYL